MGSGLTHNYVSLSIPRIGVAIGEAVLVPTALSILTDYFPPHRRILAGTLLTAASMAGASTAFLIGSFLIGWIQKCSCDGFAVWPIVFSWSGRRIPLLSCSSHSPRPQCALR
jgi:MFS family permease